MREKFDPYAAMRHLFCRVFCPCDHRKRLTVRVGIQYEALFVSFEGDFQMQLPDDQVVTASVVYKDAKGHPAQVQGAPVWASDTPAVADVTAAADGMSATVTPGTDLGTCQISVTADADLGDGVENVVALGSVEVISGTAVVGEISFGTPAAAGGAPGPT